MRHRYTAMENARTLFAQAFIKCVDPFLCLRKRTRKEHPIVIDEMVVVNDVRIDLEILRRRRELRYVELEIQLRAGSLDRDTTDGERQRQRGLMEMFLARRDELRLRGQQRIETSPLRHEPACEIGRDRDHAGVEVGNRRRAG